MKLFMINNEFPPIGGGGSTVTKYVLQYCAEQGHEVTLITSSYKGLPRKEKVDGATIIRVPAVRRYKDYCAPWELVTFGISALIYSLWAVPRVKPDVVHAFFAVPAGFVAYVINLIYGVPYVLSFEGSDMPGANPSRFAYIYPYITSLIRRIWRRAAISTVCSRGLLHLGEKHDPQYPFRFIPNGVDSSRFTPRDQKKDMEVKILFVGRLIERKGLQDVIRAIPKIKDKTSVPFKLIVAGTGIMRKQLDEIANTLGVKNSITYIGAIDQERIHEVYQDADIFVLTSKSEGMPVVTLEAMASGLPIVTSDVPGNDEIVNEGENGFLVTTGDIDTLAGRLAFLISSSLPRRQMGERSRVKSELYDWTVIARQYENAIQEVARSPVSVWYNTNNIIPSGEEVIQMSRKILFAKVFAITAAVLWVICTVFTFLLPRLSLTISEWWTHGLDLAPLGQFTITLTTFFGGGITIAIAAAVTGYIFGWSLDMMYKKH